MRIRYTSLQGQQEIQIDFLKKKFGKKAWLISTAFINMYALYLKWSNKKVKKLKEKQEYMIVLDCTSLHFFLLILMCLKHGRFGLELVRGSSYWESTVSQKWAWALPDFLIFCSLSVTRCVKETKEALIHRIYFK